MSPILHRIRTWDNGTIHSAPAMQSSFSDLEYAAKKKLTRRDRFLAEIACVLQRLLGHMSIMCPYREYPIRTPGQPAPGVRIRSFSVLFDSRSPAL